MAAVRFFSVNLPVQQPKCCLRQVGERSDDASRPKLGNWNIAVAVIYGDNRNTGCPAGCDIDNRIAYHDGPIIAAAGTRDCAPERFRVRFLQPKRVSTANCNEMLFPEYV